METRFHKYLITGATGYIGSQLTWELLRQGKEVEVLVRDAKKATRMFSRRVKVLSADLADSASLCALSAGAEAIIHCAAPTQSTYMASKPVETADSIVLGTKNVLELAKRCRAKSVVYLSSMEVYGRINSESGRTTEDELGEIDARAPRSSYPLGKRMAEYYCRMYAHEYGLPVRIARLAQTFGRGVAKDDGRVFAQFARSALRGEDIVLHTQGLSMGNYCAIDEVVDALLFLAQKGEPGEAYNVVNEANTMRIRDMAALVQKTLGNGKSQVVFDLAEGLSHGYAPDTGLRLSAAKLAGIGWQARKSLTEMYLELASSWNQ